MDKKTEELFADVYKKLNEHGRRISNVEDAVEDIKYEILKYGYRMEEMREFEKKVKRGDYKYSNLTERDGLIIAMYFMLNIKQDEIARRMNISQGQVSRIINRN